jgi:hypothetical protein
MDSSPETLAEQLCDGYCHGVVGEDDK